MRLRGFIVVVGLLLLTACGGGAPPPTVTSTPVLVTETPVPPTRRPIVIQIPPSPPPSRPPTPKPVPIAETANRIAAGDVNTCAILSGGSLKCWGGNFAGQLGQGHKDFVGDQPGEMGDILAPVNLGRGNSVSQVAVGSRHICALLDGGEVKCWGNNEFGQLGHDDGTDKSNREIGDDLAEMGDRLPAVNLGSGRTALQLSAGEDHTCALLDNDAIKCWGRNDKGQLGQGDTQSIGDDAGEMGDNLPPVDLGNGRKPAFISSGEKHNCVLFTDNSVTCWGDGSNSRLGFQMRNNIGTSENQMGDNLPIVQLDDGEPAIQVTAGGKHSCALLGGGAIQCWGTADVKGLAMPDDGLAFTQVVAGRIFACGLLGDGKVRCWGENESGQLGQGHAEETGGIADASSVDLGNGRSAIEIAAGDNHVCALLDDDSVKCWGSNARGQLGQGHRNDIGTSPDDLGDNLKPIDLG